MMRGNSAKKKKFKEKEEYKYHPVYITTKIQIYLAFSEFSFACSALVFSAAVHN
jgi:hypothetical protein